MILLPPDPDAPIYESVRLNQHYWNTAMTRKSAEEAGRKMGRSIQVFSTFMNGFASGLTQAQAEGAEVDDADDHFA
jgi:hypothetical protein